MWQICGVLSNDNLGKNQWYRGKRYRSNSEGKYYCEWRASGYNGGQFGENKKVLNKRDNGTKGQRKDSL
jgi:hypothetical protein